ncbi:HET-domain-containing protein [Rhizodiscina lignyota]|uniref:HET-domain-containing protein n=1 Tax=Rhizodiscina lignyota TaxID=1504668 RepID=A0A9P4II30_9PEZI|nr:HET-domain-containing protein [Rhizodiscina lignyota]
MPIKTTTKTLDSFARNIPWDAMPKTFRDAVTLTRVLGINHIWIDSLCIVQDDDNDWAEQSAQMARIYGSSFLTISATASSNGDGGLFRTPRQDPKLLVTAAKGSRKVSIVARRVKDIRYHKPQNSPKGELPLFPLTRRAWALQETILSKRIVYFLDDEIGWQCLGSWLCECGETASYSDQPFWSDSNFYGDPDTSSVNLWMSIVERYSNCALSKSKDKLPALSGTAQALLARTSLDVDLKKYYAGLWEFQLVDQLLWAASADGHPKSKVVPYRAPTWSWAAIDTPVAFDNRVWGLLELGYRLLHEARVLSVHYELATADQYGQVSNSHLEMSTTVFPAYVELSDNNSSLQERPELRFPRTFKGPSEQYQSFLNLRWFISITLDYPYEEAFPTLNTVTCAILRCEVEIVAKTPSGQRDCLLDVLLLKSTSSSPETFERVGVGLVHNSVSPQDFEILQSTLQQSQTVLKVI